MTWICMLHELHVSVEVAWQNAALHCWARLRFMWPLWDVHVGNRWWHPAPLSFLGTSLLTQAAHPVPAALCLCCISWFTLCHFNASDLKSALSWSVGIIGDLQSLIGLSAPLLARTYTHTHTHMYACTDMNALDLNLAADHSYTFEHSNSHLL